MDQNARDAIVLEDDSQTGRPRYGTVSRSSARTNKCDVAAVAPEEAPHSGDGLRDGVLCVSDP